jgi:hypothetical protein
MASRFWVGGTGTWDAADTTHWSATTGGAGGSSVPGAADTATFDGSSGGGTVTVNTNVAIITITMGAFTGTLDFATNNNSVTLSGLFSCSGTGTRTLNMGSNTWTLSSNNGTVWDCGTSTNLTLNAGTSTILVSANPVFNRSLSLGTSLTYNIISVDNTADKSYITSFSATTGVTIGTLTVVVPMNIAFTSTATYTITNAVNWAGTANNDAIQIFGGNGVTPTVALAGGSTISWAAIGGVTFTGSPTATNSFDLKGNSGITITGPAGSAGVIGG